MSEEIAPLVSQSSFQIRRHLSAAAAPHAESGVHRLFDFLFEAFNLVEVVFWALFAIFDLDFNQFKSSNSLCQYFLTTIMCFVIELKSEIHPLLLLFATISKSTVYWDSAFPARRVSTNI